MFKLHRSCRACGSKALIPVFSLGIQPLANAFRKAEDEQEGLVPLCVLFCPQCTLAQLSVVVNPNNLYRDYLYVTSPSKTMQEHFHAIFRDIKTEAGEVGKVLEIGSNDGLMLETFQDLGAYSVAGIEPAENLADISSDRGVTTLNEFFSRGHAELMIPGSPYDIIIARHVFCHVDDWRGFITGIAYLCAPQTLVCIEVPYAVDTIERGEFDQIYHEHLSFLTIKAMNAPLEGTSLHIHKIVRYPIHGGSIMVMLRRNDFEGAPDISVDEFINSEHVTVETWMTFAEKSKASMKALRDMVGKLSMEGKSIAGLGASAKSTVWINAAGIGQYIDFIADETPQKQGRFSPGSNIPILPESVLLERMPDYCILFAWNFCREIIEKNSEYLKRGGKFIVPVPELRFVTKDEL